MEPLAIKRSRDFPWKNNETDFSTLLDRKFKKEAIKILKEWRRAINRNAGYYKKEPETIQRSQLVNSFVKMKAELKDINNKLNNAKEQIRDLEDKIMEITQTE